MNSSSHTRSYQGFPWKILGPILFGFFVMGFVDVVGIASNYAKDEFELSDTMSSLLPMLAFICFFIFSIPTGILMGKIGKKKTVALSIIITGVAMVLPLCLNDFSVLLAAFLLLGIGNTILQVSLNPMIAQVVRPDKVSSILTAGQFIKAISSFLGPIIAAWAASSTGDWRNIFLVYAITSAISLIWLLAAVPSSKTTTEGVSLPPTFGSTLSLFKSSYIVFMFLGILCVVGIDVGLNTSLPKLFMAKTGIDLQEAGYSTSVYFAARTLGTFFGTFYLARFSAKVFYQWNTIIAIAAFILLITLTGQGALYAMTAIIGFTCANIFPIIFSYALRHAQGRDNEISALMIMGVSGGALFPFTVGALSDVLGQLMGIATLGICFIYIFIISFAMKDRNF